MTVSLNNVRAALNDGPLRILISSVEGWGKTTFANHFPNAIYIAPEDGFPRDLDPLPQVFEGLTSWSDVLDAIDVLINEEHEFRTLVIDSLDWVEPLCHAFICQRDSGRKTEMNKGGHKLESIEDYGYGKGYVCASEEFRNLIAKLVELRTKRHMHIVVLSHSQIKKFNNPEGEDYDRWEPKVHGKTARLFVEWSDAHLFGFYEVEAGKIGDERKAKGVSTGRRVFGTQHNATYDAKNRLGMPPRVPVNLDGIQALVDQMLASVRDPVDYVSPKAAAEHQRAKADASAARDVAAKELERNAREVARDPGGTAAAKSAAAQERVEERAAPVEEPKKARAAKKQADNAPPADINSAASWRIRIGEKLDSPLIEPNYVRKVQGWVNDAGEDAKKLEAVFHHVLKNVA
jgi:hypothetical protein